MGLCKRIKRLFKIEKLYHKKHRSVIFYKQRGKQLEDIIVDMGKVLRENNLVIPIWGRGVTGNMLLNDIGTMEFQSEIMYRIEQEVR